MIQMAGILPTVLPAWALWTLKLLRQAEVQESVQRRLSSIEWVDETSRSAFSPRPLVSTDPLRRATELYLHLLTSPLPPVPVLLSVISRDNLTSPHRFWVEILVIINQLPSGHSDPQWQQGISILVYLRHDDCGNLRRHDR